MNVTLHFDGSITKNPGGVMRAGWVIRCEDGRKARGGGLVTQGRATCNVAEWGALEMGLAWLASRDDVAVTHLEIFGDSQLVINWLNGRKFGKKGQHLRVNRVRCLALLKALDCPWVASWIPRRENAQADAQSRATGHPRGPRGVETVCEAAGRRNIENANRMLDEDRANRERYRGLAGAD